LAAKVSRFCLIFHPFHLEEVLLKRHHRQAAGSLIQFFWVSMVSQAMEKGKIGRHGLGFNSIFNITDLPSILSGESLGDLEQNRKIGTFV
jgi:hypothetical protein